MTSRAEAILPGDVRGADQKLHDYDAQQYENGAHDEESLLSTYIPMREVFVRKKVDVVSQSVENITG